VRPENKIKRIKMKFAAPLKMNKEESAITKVLGKAKYFGLYDEVTNQLEVIVNEDPTGPAIFQVLKARGVDAVLTPHAGPGAVNASMQLGIDLYYCGDERKTLMDAVKEFQEGKYHKITPENFHLYR
jgi:predicted Fe-Mo cluster-binding NifX family protein